MKLQILIPQYKETEKIIEPLLRSIEIQQTVDVKNDVGAIIVNDGSKVRLSKEFLGSFNFDIQYYINTKHQGVSAARNYALDKATADYIMFCDADDMFMNACGFYIVFREMENNGFDALTSVFIEETRDTERNVVFINHDMDTTFVHGKIYRRQYLIDNHIRWNKDLTIHEDSYFNCLAQRLAKEHKYCQQPFYLWRWRDASVCRHDPKYILKTYNNMLDSSTALVNEFIKREHIQDAQMFATSMIFDAYYMMNKEEWLNQENREYRNKTEKRFKKYYADFKLLFDSIPKEAKTQIVMGMKNRFFGEGLLLESITFEDWIKKINDL